MFRKNGFITVLFVTCLLSATLFGSALAQDDGEGRDLVFEQEILDRLAAINPEAVHIFQEAAQASDAGDYEACRASLEFVLLLAPDFPDALRRMSYCEIALDLNQAGLEHAQRAYDLDPNPYNQTTLAYALLIEGSPASQTKAYNLASEAAVQLPDEALTQHVLMFAAADRQEYETLRTASQALLRLEPENPMPHYFIGLLEADEGRWENAERELLLAQELGMPAEDVQQVLSESRIATMARVFRSLKVGGVLVAGWLGGMLLLFLAGVILSGSTMAAIRRAQDSPHPQPSPVEKLARSIYRLVIGLTSFYFYFSIPFVILIVVVAVAAVIYLFFAVSNALTLRLAFIIGIAGLYTLYVIVRSVFTRLRQEEPGRPLEREAAPALWRLTDEVAEKLETSAIQAIYITPGVEVAVTEQGSLWKKLNGKGRRCLILGLGVLNDMTQGQLKAVLAHEYGHFSAKDTAGGDLANQVNVSVYNMAFGLARTGVASWFNPAWLFVNGFYRIFLRITRGASRLQEILADRQAAVAYGASQFIEGLRHIISQNIIFNARVNYEIEQSLHSHSRLHNLYALPNPPLDDWEQKLISAKEEAFNRPPSAYDTHPSPSERFRLVEKYGIARQAPSFDDHRPAWELLPNAAQLQEEMTSRVQMNVDAQTGGTEDEQEAEPE